MEELLGIGVEVSELEEKSPGCMQLNRMTLEGAVYMTMKQKVMWIDANRLVTAIGNTNPYDAVRWLKKNRIDIIHFNDALEQGHSAANSLLYGVDVVDKTANIFAANGKCD